MNILGHVEPGGAMQQPMTAAARLDADDDRYSTPLWDEIPDEPETWGISDFDDIVGGLDY